MYKPISSLTARGRNEQRKECSKEKEFPFVRFLAFNCYWYDIIEPDIGRAASHDPGRYQIQEGITFALGKTNKKEGQQDWL
jgi:hypothetical protein